MKKKFIISICIFLLIVIVILVNYNIKNSENINSYNKITKIILGNNITINVEIADNYSEREKGLMFRERLDENSGMFFIFENEDMQSFWMKNTFIPLDIIFIDSNLKIINIEQAVPCSDTGDDYNCKNYYSKSPTKYVLEVNAGFCEKDNIKTGDYVQID